MFLHNECGGVRVRLSDTSEPCDGYIISFTLLLESVVLNVKLFALPSVKPNPPENQFFKVYWRIETEFVSVK
jgi:hypothetical protein